MHMTPIIVFIWDKMNFMKFLDLRYAKQTLEALRGLD